MTEFGDKQRNNVYYINTFVKFFAKVFIFRRMCAILNQ